MTGLLLIALAVVLAVLVTLRSAPSVVALVVCAGMSWLALTAVFVAVTLDSAARVQAEAVTHLASVPVLVAWPLAIGACLAVARAPSLREDQP